MPYTYLLGWSRHNLFYYGVRYAAKADPSDLWTTYFTSSKYVKELRKVLGEPDVVEVRRTFSDRKAAMVWEHTVLRRMKVVHDPRWINKTDNAAIDFKTSKRNTKPGREAFLKKVRGKTWEELYGPERAAEMKEKVRQGLLARKTVPRGWKHKDKENYVAAAKKRWADPAFREKQRAAVKASWEFRRQAPPK